MSENFSIEARVLAGCYWNLIPNSRISFNRPWAIHPKARKGLTELVESGYLDETPRNHIKDCPVDFTPTEKMRQFPFPDMDWLRENGDFPMTIQSKE